MAHKRGTNTTTRRLDVSRVESKILQSGSGGSRPSADRGEEAATVEATQSAVEAEAGAKTWRRRHHSLNKRASKMADNQGKQQPQQNGGARKAPRPLVRRLFAEFVHNNLGMRDEWFTTKAHASLMKHNFGWRFNAIQRETSRAIIEECQCQGENWQAEPPNKTGGKERHWIFISHHLAPSKPCRIDPETGATMRHAFFNGESNKLTVHEEVDWSTLFEEDQDRIANPDKCVRSCGLRLELGGRINQLNVDLVAATRTEEQTIVAIPDYWDSANARKLFNPPKDMPVVECLEERVQRLKDAVNFLKKREHVVADLLEEHHVNEDFSQYQQQDSITGADTYKEPMNVPW